MELPRPLALIFSRRFWTRSVRLPAPASCGVLRLGVAPGILGLVTSRWGGVFVGWGYDADAPLRPWPAPFRSTTPKGHRVAGWAFCGFFVQRSFPRAAGVPPTTLTSEGQLLDAQRRPIEGS